MPSLPCSGKIQQYDADIFELYCFFVRQKIDLIRNVERVVFWTPNDQKLYSEKHELLSQINNLDITISGTGFFNLNRHFLAGVRSIISAPKENQKFLFHLLIADGRRLFHLHYCFHSILFGRKVVEKSKRAVNVYYCSRALFQYLLLLLSNLVSITSEAFFCQPHKACSTINDWLIDTRRPNIHSKHFGIRISTA